MKHFSVLILFTAISLFFGMKSAYSIQLNGIEVPKDKFVVYIMVGHSNMAGRVSELDVSEHPRAWNYYIKDFGQNLPHHTWILAKDCIHKDFSGSGAGPCMPFLKKMVNEFPNYYFGVVENGNSGVECRQNYLKNNEAGTLDLYSEMVNALDTIKNSVTFGGIICMLGVAEACNAADSTCRKFSSDIALMVQQFRDTLGLPKLPFLMGGFERDGPSVKSDGKYWQIIDSQTNLVPSMVPVSGLIPSDSLAYFDRWHYTKSSYLIWTQRAVNIIKANRWFPAHQVDVFHYCTNTTGQPISATNRGSIICDALGKKIRPFYLSAPYSDKISPECSYIWSIKFSKNKQALSGPR